MITRAQSKRKREAVELREGNEVGCGSACGLATLLLPTFPDDIILRIGKALNQAGWYGTQASLLSTSKRNYELLLPDLYRHINLRSTKSVLLLKTLPEALVEGGYLEEGSERIRVLRKYIAPFGRNTSSTERPVTTYSGSARRFAFVQSLRIDFGAAWAFSYPKRSFDTNLHIYRLFPRLRNICLPPCTRRKFTDPAKVALATISHFGPRSFCIHFPRTNVSERWSGYHPYTLIANFVHDVIEYPHQNGDLAIRFILHGFGDVTSKEHLPIYYPKAEMEYHFTENKAECIPDEDEWDDRIPFDDPRASDRGRQIRRLVHYMWLYHSHLALHEVQSIREVRLYGALDNINWSDPGEDGNDDAFDPESSLRSKVREHYTGRLFEGRDRTASAVFETILAKLVFLPSSAGTTCSECGYEL